MRFLLSFGHCFDGKAAVPLLKPVPIERTFSSLNDAPRIPTRYNKCANNFLSAVCLVALI